MSIDLSGKLLTTIDNPFNPHTEFEEWNSYDIRKGYNTLAYIARVANTSSELPNEMENDIYDRAIEEILDLNILGIYVLAEKP